MLNKNRLKAAILANDGRQDVLAKAMGISLSQLSLRINGHREFRASEVAFIRDRYNLTDAEVCQIFFAEKVS